MPPDDEWKRSEILSRHKLFMLPGRLKKCGISSQHLSLRNNEPGGAVRHRNCAQNLSDAIDAGPQAALLNEEATYFHWAVNCC